MMNDEKVRAKDQQPSAELKELVKQASNGTVSDWRRITDAIASIGGGCDTTLGELQIAAKKIVMALGPIGMLWILISEESMTEIAEAALKED